MNPIIQPQTNYSIIKRKAKMEFFVQRIINYRFMDRYNKYNHLDFRIAFNSKTFFYQ